MNLKAIVIVLGLLLCFLDAPLSAQTSDGDITVQAEGFGMSKKDALLKAKRNAVEKGIGTVLISHTEVNNFELQKDIILSKTIGSVKQYDILQEQTEVGWICLYPNQCAGLPCKHQSGSRRAQDSSGIHGQTAHDGFNPGSRWENS